MSPSQICFEEDSVFRIILHLKIYVCLKYEITVKPLITNTSKEFIKCRISDNGMLQIFSFSIK